MSQSQTTTQTQPKASPTPPQPNTRDSQTTADNTARNANINDPKSKPDPKGSQNGTDSITPEDEVSPEQAEKLGLPEQKHAGKVGYGPEFANKDRATMGDKFTGLKEEIMGKVKKNPELVQKGHERRAGELKKKEREEKETDPFANADEKDEKKSGEEPSSQKQDGNASKSSSVKTNEHGPEVNDKPARDGTQTNPPVHPDTVDLKGDGGKGYDLGGKNRDVDLSTKDARLDSSHPAQNDENVQRAAEL